MVKIKREREMGMKSEGYTKRDEKSTRVSEERGIKKEMGLKMEEV